MDMLGLFFNPSEQFHELCDNGVDCVTADATFTTEHHLKPETKICMWKKWHGLKYTDIRAKCQGKHVWYGHHLGATDGGGRKSNM